MAYDDRFVDIALRLTNYEPGYLQRNPNDVVPTLVHGKQVLADSVRIVKSKYAAFQAPKLIPKTRTNGSLAEIYDAKIEDVQRWPATSSHGHGLRLFSSVLHARRNR